MPWENPKTDWSTNPKNPRSEDFNRIEGNIDFLKQDIETKKGSIVDALASVGVAVTIEDSYEDISNEIIDSNKGAVTVTPGTTNKPIIKGFHNGEGYVVGDQDLISANILQGKNIFGVAGSAIDGKNMKKVAFGSASYISDTIITVSGLSFTPKFVFLRMTAFTNNGSKLLANLHYYSSGNSPFPDISSRMLIYNQSSSSQEYYNEGLAVTAGGFSTIHKWWVSSGSPTYHWMAIG